MRKVVESCILIAIVFAFLFSLLEVSFESGDEILLIGLANNALKIYFSMAGFILVSNNLYTKINNRANMMATSYLLVSALTLINLSMLMTIGNDSMRYITYMETTLQRNIVEILLLIICVKWINEYCNIKIWLGLVGSVIVGCIIVSFIPSSIDGFFIKYGETAMFGIAVGLILGGISLIGWISSREKIKQMSLAEQKICHLLYLDKILTYIVIILLCTNYSFELRVILNFLELLFYVVIFSYVDKSTLSITWKKIASDVIDKEEQVNRKQIEKKILVASAAEVESIIERINKQSKAIGEKIAETNKREDIQYIDKIEKNCHRLIKLSNNILSLNHYEKGEIAPHFQSVNLTELVGNVVSSIEPYLKQKEVALQYITPHQTIIGDVDREAVERILLNLISNSIKYTNDKSDIRLFLFVRKQHIYLIIQDAGVGIPNELLMTIFTRFARVDSKLTRQQEGSGLGLAIVKSLVDLHKGEIEIKSKVNKGTIISIILPLKQDKVDSTEKDKNRPNKDLMKKIQIEFSDLGVWFK